MAIKFSKNGILGILRKKLTNNKIYLIFQKRSVDKKLLELEANQLINKDVIDASQQRNQNKTNAQIHLMNRLL